MTSAIVDILTDPATLAVLATAVLTAAYSSYRANETLLKRLDPSGQRHAPSLSEHLIDENSRVLETTTALAFPILATVSIIFLFFFLRSVGFVLTLISTFSGFIAVLFLLWPLGEFVVRRLRYLGVSLGTGGSAEFAIVAPVVSAIILTWLFTGHWVANDVIGVGLCVLFASLCKVPNLKAAVVVFAGLFAYDIFFVFFSERFFGRNVMVEVATSEPTNPAYEVANFFNSPVLPVKRLALPAKLIIPAGNGMQTILGLGDIILPTIMLVYLLETDIRCGSRPLGRGFFGRALIAYLFGLMTSFVFTVKFKAAQPALLYIVPAVLLPTLWTAKRRNELVQLWNGPTRGDALVDSVSSANATASQPDSSSKDDESTALMA